MQTANCPFCKATCEVVNNKDPFGIPCGDILAGHEKGPAPAPSLGPEWRRWCLGTGMSRRFAEGVAADRDAGVHLLAHP